MSSTTQFPSLVMIIRHGEKPGTPANDKDGGPHLSERGTARAAALPSLFTPDPNATPVTGMEQLSCDLTTSAAGQFVGAYITSGVAAGQARFPRPNFLFATKQDPPDTGSNRPAETITPLAQALQSLTDPTINSTINQDFTDDDYDDLAKQEILGKPEIYSGKVILICWHHGKAPDLAESLGVSKNQLKKWKPWDPTVFDLLFCITWDAGQANLVVDYQQLLYGDTPS